MTRPGKRATSMALVLVLLVVATVQLVLDWQSGGPRVRDVLWVLLVVGVCVPTVACWVPLLRSRLGRARPSATVLGVWLIAGLVVAAGDWLGAWRLPPWSFAPFVTGTLLLASPAVLAAEQDREGEGDHR